MSDLGFLPYLLGFAVLIPLLSFFVILVGAPKLGKSAGMLASAAIIISGVLAFYSFGIWLVHHYPDAPSHDPHAHAEAHPPAVPPVTHTYWVLGKFGDLEVTINCYIDTLTLVMFCMVTLIASCIHLYATGYMHDELSEFTDPEVTLADGRTLRRPGRYPRFFQYLSLFCFSMLGLVLAGNVAMVFVFWELVGICSYFLIGFYIERKSASNAANKAFIVNRIGDFGMIIGLMAIWTGLGTFSFGDDGDKPGIFSLVRPAENEHHLETPDGMVKADASKEVEAIFREHIQFDDARGIAAREANNRVDDWRKQGYGYWLLVIGGIGIFCGCVGKSAQFPLHVWLPDAMEGPTPVSALVHSATMVAAGVYLVGRFFPVFTPEVLLVIATTGCITLFLAATIAITAVDIKRVLAYSTVSQLGYMMLALGVGGWLAGMMHLITHAFFKSLLFLCSGSVIHAVHTNDMRKMGGLFKKMPVTAITMLTGCLAIAGVGLPLVIGFSGYYSKDMILEQAYSMSLTNLHNHNSLPGVFFLFAAGGAAITAFYMFRMWYMTFVGKPRDAHAYEHAHESPAIMYLPLVVLAIFAVSVAWSFHLIGYAIVPAAILIYQGTRLGWFKAMFAPAHHGDHGHDDHGHDASHGTHGTHGSHTSHTSLDASHDASHVSHSTHASAQPWNRNGVIAMIIATVIAGAIIQAILPGSAGEDQLTLQNLLEQARPAGTAADVAGRWITWTWPNEHTAHLAENEARIKVPVVMLATGTWVIGIGLATFMYGLGYMNPEDVRRQFSPIYRLLWNKWWFDELYDWLFVRPTHVISRFIASIDRNWIDGLIDGSARLTRAFSNAWDYWADRTLIDGTANLLASWTYSAGLALRHLQTGRVRQYVMFIVIGAIAIFVLISFFWSSTFAH